MAILKLKVSDNILDKVLWLLGQFKSSDLEIVKEDSLYETHKESLHAELQKVEEGNSKSYSLDEIDKLLEETINLQEI